MKVKTRGAKFLPDLGCPVGRGRLSEGLRSAPGVHVLAGGVPIAAVLGGICAGMVVVGVVDVVRSR